MGNLRIIWLFYVENRSYMTLLHVPLRRTGEHMQSGICNKSNVIDTGQRMPWEGRDAAKIILLWLYEAILARMRITSCACLIVEDLGRDVEFFVEA